jgi:formate hydrogenlyase subunit 4
MIKTDLISPLLTLFLAPFLFGVISRVKAVFGGRQGAPLLQPYFDLVKGIQKGLVYSRSTSWVFRFLPIIGIAGVFSALLFLPQSASVPVFSFTGDIFVFVYILASIRFFMILAALDTSSAFEGMGASREAFISLLAEPVLLVGLVSLLKISGSTTFADALNCPFVSHLSVSSLFVAAALFIVLLAENARIPVDDPATHLELTMIHEVMVLDHSGPDFAIITYVSALKLWIFTSMVVQIIIPFHLIQNGLLRIGATMGAVLLGAIVIGVAESVMARLRLNRLPQLLAGAGAFAIMAFLFALRGGV